MNPELLLAHFDRISDAPDAIPRLRQFILDLAVRGKLVEHDPTDESASLLLKRIREDRARLVKQGSLKHWEPSGTTAINGSTFLAPPGWVLTTLGEVTLKITDGAHKTPTYVDEGIPFISVKDFSGGTLDFSSTRLIPANEHAALYKRCDPRRGDILIGRIGTLGKAVFVDTDREFSLFVSVGLIRFSHEFIAPQYFRLVLNSPLVESEYNRIKVGGGTHTNKLNLGDLHTVIFPLPPLGEQHRIVAKVDELMALCDSLAEALKKRESSRDRLASASLDRLNNGANADAFRDHANFCLAHIPLLTTSPFQIKHLRQTLLNLAIRGLLVPQDPKDEFAAEFLGERRHIPNSEPWKLPSGWAWSSFSLIGETLGGGTPSKAHPEFWKGAIPWVSPKDMKVDVITDSQDHISTAAVEQSAVRLIPTGSLLVVVRGMILAHSFPTASTEVPVTINQDMKAIVPFRADLIRFLLLLTKGLKPEVLRLVLRSTHGTCKLLTDDLFSLPIPIPPLAEQRRILAKVNELMAICDRLETTLSAKRSGTDRLLEAVLHSALPNAGTPRAGLDGSEMKVSPTPQSAVLTS